jgi:biotin carboxyl carrier protein
MPTFTLHVDNQYEFSSNAESIEAFDLVSDGPDSWHILQDGKAFRARLESINPQTKELVLVINGTRHQVRVKDELDLLVDKLGFSTAAVQTVREINAPMPGLVFDILVVPDQTISKGESLLILEAMKMENVLKAPADAVVEAVLVQKGQAVEKGQLLIRMA